MCEEIWIPNNIVDTRYRKYIFLDFRDLISGKIRRGVVKNVEDVSFYVTHALVYDGYWKKKGFKKLFRYNKTS